MQPAQLVSKPLQTGEKGWQGAGKGEEETGALTWPVFCPPAGPERIAAVWDQPACQIVPPHV